ncbi:MAG TPA: acetyl-CoA carboxylase carboxyl transferase subunit beta, partial [Verrucomicrobiae bacterium]|nr:acetyl-CoA carboxylase carboxyl transferase subunit beta [Verrucomicrobiae bacterium]
MDTTSFLKKTIGVETVEPALTPPPSAPATFVKKPKLASGKAKKRDIPEGLWTKCPGCETMIFDKELDENLKVCPKCQHHFPIGSRERIHSLVETCTFEEMDAEMMSVDVLKFKGVTTYKSKLEEYRKS